MYNENNKLYIKKKRHNFKHISIQISIPQNTKFMVGEKSQ